MYCPRCGAPLNNGVCPYCSTSGAVGADAKTGAASYGVPGKRSPNKKLLLAAIIAAAVLALGGIGLLVNALLGNASPEANAIYKEYTAVTDDVKELEAAYVTDGNVPPEKTDALLDEVEKLANQYQADGIIDSYDRQENSICFKFSSGANYLYTPPSTDFLAGSGEILTIEPYASVGEFDSCFQYTGKNPDQFAGTLAENLPTQLSFPNANDWDTLTFDQVSQMGDHQVILWFGHGGYTREFGSVLGTSVDIRDARSIKPYVDGLRNGEILLSADKFCISAAFFDKHLQDGSLNGSMVILAACESAADNRLATAFINKGASVVMANDKSIRVLYMLDMLDTFVTELSRKEGNTCPTADEALLKAKQKHGYRDSIIQGVGAQVQLIYAEGQSDYRLSDTPAQSAPQTEPQTQPQTPAQSGDKITITTNGAIPSIPAKVLSPNSAVEILMENQDVWMITDPTNQVFGYSLLDVDFDGTLELISSEYGGSGFFSFNRYFKIDAQNRAVKEIASPDEDEGGFDYYAKDSDNLILLKDQSSGAMAYYSLDSVRAASSENGVLYGTFYYKGGQVRTDVLFSETRSGANQTFSYFQNDKPVELDKQRYQKLKAEYLRSFPDMDLDWERIDGYVYSTASAEHRKRMLLEAYTEFSYEGFSFERINTYDAQAPAAAPTAPTVSKTMVMCDYKGMTLGDVIKMWGSDYKILDSLLYGGWGGIYYEDERCPFMFCFRESAIPTKIDPSAPLAGIEAYPSAKDGKFYVTDNLPITHNYAKVAAALRDGEGYFDEMEGGLAYDGDVNGCHYNFVWDETATTGAPRLITVSF